MKFHTWVLEGLFTCTRAPVSAGGEGEGQWAGGLCSHRLPVMKLFLLGQQKLYWM